MRFFRTAFQNLTSGFSAQHQDTGNTRVQAGLHIGVYPVAYHAGLLLADAQLLHGKLRHQGGGLADDHGPLLRGIVDHVADASAVRDGAELRGADIVRVGGDVGQLPGQQQTADVPELPEGQLRVEAHDDTFGPVGILGHIQTGPGQLRLERGGAADVEGLFGVVLPQIPGGGLGGGDEILPGGGNAQILQLADIVLHAFGGIVGHKEVAAAGFPDPAQQIDGEGEEPVPQIEGSVQVEQEKLHGLDGFLSGHGGSPYAFFVIVRQGWGIVKPLLGIVPKGRTNVRGILWKREKYPWIQKYTCVFDENRLEWVHKFGTKEREMILYDNRTNRGQA